jgi:hypothetical protein
MKNKKIRILNRFVITIIISVFVFACNTPNDVPNQEVVGVSKEHISLDDAKFPYSLCF